MDSISFEIGPNFSSKAQIEEEEEVEELNEEVGR